MSKHEGRLDELLFNILFKEYRQYVEPGVRGLHLKPADSCLPAGLFVGYSAEIYPRMLRDQFSHGSSPERWIKVDLCALVVDDPSSKLVCACNDYLLGKVHHVFVVGIGPVDLKGGKLRIVFHVHALVTELLPDLIDSSEHPYDQPLEIEFSRYPKVHIYVKRIVVRNERPGICSTRYGREDRCLDLKSSVVVKYLAEGLHYFCPFAECLLYLGVG